MHLSIIIPLYNEAKLIRPTLDLLSGVSFPDFVTEKEIIVVDDHSTDGSYQAVTDYALSHAGVIVLHHEKNMGKGAAVMTGAEAASGDVIVVQDADSELNPADIPAILETMQRNNLRIAGGSRFIKEYKAGNKTSVTDFVNRMFSFLASRVAGKKITDLTCGYKAIRKDLFLELNLREKRFGFETELMMKSLCRHDVLFEESAVTYKPRNRAEGKKIRATDGPSILWKIFRYGFEGRKWFSVIAAVIIILVISGTVWADKRWKKENKVIEWDVISYYAYLPATFIYHDPGLSFIDNYKGPHKFIFWPERAPNGSYVIKTTMGLSLLYLPFFAAGHAAAVITGADAGGFSEPYKFALILSAVFFLGLGLYYLRKILLEFFSDTVTAIILFAFVFGTNVFWYAVYESAMSHIYSFAVIACFLWQTIKWYRKPSAGNAAAIGLLAGLITLIRPTNGIIALVFLFYNIFSLNSLKERFKFLAVNFRLLLLIAAAAIIVWIPQLIYWKSLTGHLLFFSYTNNERFFFSHPQIINGLFSFRKGLFIYTPLTLFSVAGIWHLWKSRSPFAMPVSIFFPLNAYIIFSWWCWWYGGSFGQRPFIDSYALMALPVAAILQSIPHIKSFITRYSVAFIFSVTVLLGLYYQKQYYYGAIHWDSMTREAFFDSFGRLHPSARFNSLLAAPDYDKAKEGIQAVIRPEVPEKK